MHGSDRVAFASTVRALRRSDFVSEMEEGAVAEFIHFGYVTDDKSIFKGGQSAGGVDC